MKKLIILFLSTLIFYSCGKEEPGKIETFSTEAFAYDLGNSWEVNAETRVKGFNQKEDKNKFVATIAYDIDLVTPEGDTIKALVSKVEDKKAGERMMDIPVEAQFVLDSTYAAGEYKIIFNVRDAGNHNTSTSSAVFQLDED